MTISAASVTGIPVLAGLIVAVAALLVPVVIERRQARVRAELASSQKTLEDRLDELSASMRDSARLVEQVSAELDARAVTARRLKEEAEAAEALAWLHREQAEAVRRMVNAEL